MAKDIKTMDIVTEMMVKAVMAATITLQTIKTGATMAATNMEAITTDMVTVVEAAAVITRETQGETHDLPQPLTHLAVSETLVAIATVEAVEQSMHLKVTVIITIIVPIDAQ
jgi:hypothetical protein